MTRKEANALIGQVRSALGEEAITETCSRDGCDVSIGGLPTPLLIADVDVQSLSSSISGKRPDFIVFHPDQTRGGSQLVAMPLELKSGNFDPVGVCEQLQGGAIFLEKLGSAVARCRPVLVHGCRIPARQLRVLNRQKVVFHNRRLTILKSRCGLRRNLLNALTGR